MSPSLTSLPSRPAWSLLAACLAVSCQSPAAPWHPFQVTYGGRAHVLRSADADSAAERALLQGLRSRVPAHLPLHPVRLEDGTLVVATGRVHLRWNPGTDAVAREALALRVAPEATQALAHLGDLWTLGERLPGLLPELAADPSVASAEPELAIPVSRHSPNDPVFPHQWHLENGGQEGAARGADVGATGAWNVTRGSPEIIVAIIDDGVDVHHEDLDPCRLVPGHDFFGDDDDPQPAFWDSHGTSAAGVVGASQDNLVGGSGICPQCRILPIRLLGSPESAAEVRSQDGAVAVLDTHVAQAFTFAVDHGAAVLFNGWGAPDRAAGLPLASVVQDAITYARTQGRGGKGSLVVFAAGNGNRDVAADSYASCAGCITVAASNDQDKRVATSNFGAAITVAAPSAGVAGLDGARTTGIWTTDVSGSRGSNAGEPVTGDRRGNYTNWFGGTSAAAALTAGTLGLVLSANPTLTASQALEILKSTALKIDVENGAYDANGHSTRYGWGRIRAKEAVLAATQPALGTSCRPGCGTEWVCIPGAPFDDYCTRTCTLPADCPAGFTCALAATEQEPGRQACVRDATCPAGVELCGDQVDNNGDTVADEGCPTPCTNESFDGRCSPEGWVACEHGQELRGACPAGSACITMHNGLTACAGCGGVAQECQDGQVVSCGALPGVDAGILRHLACPVGCAVTSGEPACACPGGNASSCSADGGLRTCLQGVPVEIPCAHGCGQPTPTSPLGCRCEGNLSERDTCVGNALAHCNLDLGETVVRTCAHGCGTDPVTGLDGCQCEGGVTSAWQCQENTLVSCDLTTGNLVERPCANGCANNQCTCPGGVLLSECDGSERISCNGLTGELTRTPCPHGCVLGARGAALCVCDNGAAEDVLCQDGNLLYCDTSTGTGSAAPCEHGCGPAELGGAACKCADQDNRGVCQGTTLRYCDGLTNETRERTCTSECYVDPLGFARCRDGCGAYATYVQSCWSERTAYVCGQDGETVILRDCAELGMVCAVTNGRADCVEAPDGGIPQDGGTASSSSSSSSSSGGGGDDGGGGPSCACAQADRARGPVLLLLLGVVLRRRTRR